MGNPLRHDDGAGLLVAAQAMELHGKRPGHVTMLPVGPVADPLDLLWDWEGADIAIIADSVRSELAPGTLTFAWLARDGGAPIARGGRPASSHGLGVVGAYRLALAVGRAPRQLVLVGIEGTDFSHGEGLSEAVAAAVPAAARLVVHLANKAMGKAPSASSDV
jgi:hydrogenase maturation protease